ESIAQKLAADWKAMTEKVTGGNVAHQSAYLEVDQKRASWNPSERELIEKAEPFLQKAIEIYNSK
ncbi:MAG TPA: MerR family transcriptional regulator, partial [Firmicutes bacterium]|nr:MerR family transcriptional regulator [Bacillota bacterium]